MTKQELETLPSLSLAEIRIKLQPFITLHQIEITDKEIIFSDLDLCILSGVKGYVPQDKVAISEIVYIDEGDKSFFRIVLRSGSYHVVSKVSGARFCGMLTEEEPVPDSLWKSFWQKSTRFIKSLLSSI
ncbi:MAG: hypothetical protein LUH22_15065 [Bacteroides sp.]|nr:hypothetical protein [Bacteroides sp.]